MYHAHDGQGHPADLSTAPMVIKVGDGKKEKDMEWSDITNQGGLPVSR
jgi:hypothetical protein